MSCKATCQCKCQNPSCMCWDRITVKNITESNSQKETK